MKKSELFCISGFLGQGSDWDFLKSKNWKATGYRAEEFLPLPHISESDSVKAPFWEAARRLNSMAEKEGKNILMGYSLGGRLALHALLADQNGLWEKAIIISANPGCLEEAEKKQRLMADFQWAEKFKNESWGGVLHEWADQPVFGGKALPLPRPENSANKEALARLLTEFSLGRQENLRSLLSGIKIPVLFVAGREDEKFSKFAEEMGGLCPQAQVWIAHGAGHRVPWELDSKIFINGLVKFVEE